MKIQTTLNTIARVASEKSEVVAACMVFVVVSMMVIPVPAAVLDVCIAFNMTLSALLVIIAVLLSSPLAFSSFPAVLLISTLFRLSISVSTTRLILLDGYSGHIVESFGEFVIGGNVVVGIIVFLIIAVVNFLVVTKGSERVAEVAARFSLDGMPGKQMSIDSDLRAGLIDQHEAKSRRSRLERESQLFGAMDGAVKFVKGDAIAGFLIVFINLVGGLTIGMMQKGMDFATAGARYSLLSVGDGLVALIPSLMVSIAAGMIVTRVSKGEGSSNSVAADMARELIGNPRALILAVVFACAFAMIPGMPGLVFLAMAMSLAIPWFFMRRSVALETAVDLGSTAHVPNDFLKPVEDVSRPRRIRPLIISFAQQIPSHRRDVLENVCRMARNRMLEQFGVNMPAIEFVRASYKQADDVSVLIHEVPALGFFDVSAPYIVRRRPQRQAEHAASDIQISDAGLIDDINPPPSGDLVDPSISDSAGQAVTVVDSGTGLNVTDDSLYATVSEPVRGTLLTTASQAAAVKLLAQGYELESYESYLVELVTECFLTNAKAFFSAQELSNWLSQQEQEMPDVVKDLQRVVPNSRLHDILLRLLGERVSIQNFETIASCLSEWAARERDLVILTEHVRMALAAQICHAHAHEGVLYGFVVGNELETLVRQSLRQTANGSYLDIDDETRNRLISHIHQTVPYYLPSGASPVLLSPADCRRYVRRIYDQSITWLQVISFSEVPSSMKVNVVGELGVI